MHRSPHLVAWDDTNAANQMIDAGEMMRRLARVLNGDYREKQVRGEPRYEIERTYVGGLVLLIIAGHIYDDRETLSLVIELRAAASARPLVSYHLSGGLQRVKASHDTAWLRSDNGTIAIVGEGLGGIVEIQN